MTVSVPIVAIATAAGRGGIGVIRASGPDLAPLIAAVCGRPLLARQATYLPFLGSDGTPIDHGIAIHFPAPHSYTGEDVLELQGHGGPVVMQLLLARCLEAGAGIGLRLAQPGEFTQRAFLNDKLDLAQAEAVADLIEATTEAAARSASRSLAGAFSTEIDALVDRVIALRMLVEATLDFPEEEIDFLEKSDARGQLDGIRAQLDLVLATARQGALLREGLHVVLAGEPNVGKSSLLNALAGAELAIVTPIAGTTRDRVEQTIQIEGIPLHVIDTAGLRDTDDEVEKIGIARSWDAIANADLVLHLVDAAQPQSGDGLTSQLRNALPADVPVVTVCNKIDAAGLTAHVDETHGTTQIWLSAKERQGIDLLRAQLLKVAGWQSGTEGLYLARERHLVALRHAQAHLATAADHAARSDQQLDLFAEELRLAQEQLSEITGAFTPDDLLGVIFSRFCIGK